VINGLNPIDPFILEKPDMEDISFMVVTLFVAFTVIAGLVLWVVRYLLCSAQHEACSVPVLITGCDTGIGHEVARHLDMLGCHVFAGCLNMASEGAQRLRVEASARLTLVQMDVTREDQLDKAVEFIEENLPPGSKGLWAVVNNAGVCVCGEFDWQTLEQIEKQVAVNLMGTLRVTKLFLPLLKRGHGRILNVSSVAGVYAYPGLSVYCATKHAVEGFSQVLRLELDKFGVNVISIQLGDFSTATNLLNSHHKNMNHMWAEMTDQSREDYKQYFLAYHDMVAKSGFTGHRMKPSALLPQSVLRGFEVALLAKVPSKTYSLLPTWTNMIKLVLMGMMPSVWSQKIVSRRYNKSLGRKRLRQNV